RVSEHEQGELQGAIQSLRSITFIIGPVLFSQTFSWFIDPKHSFQHPGAPYFLGAALLFSAMLLATRIEQAPAAPAGSTIGVEVPPSEIAAGAAPVIESEGKI